MVSLLYFKACMIFLSLFFVYTQYFQEKKLKLLENFVLKF